MSPIDSHDLSVAHDLGTLEGKVGAIYDNTKVIPELIAKVAKHETQLRFIRKLGFVSLVALLGLIVEWIKTQFSSGR